MFKRILVPLDGSEYATRAIPLAAHIARATQAHVVLTGVLDVSVTYVTYMGPVPLPQTAIDVQYDILHAHLVSQARRSEFAGVSVSTDLLTGPAAVTLLDAIEHEAIDLVVMNSHGHGGLVRWLLGSVAEHLVHYATAPLLILRESSEAPSAPPIVSNMAWEALVGLDGSPLAEEALTPTIQLIQALSNSSRGRVRLVRVVRPMSEADDLESVLGGPERLRAAHELVISEAGADLEAVAQRLRTQYPALEITAAVVEDRDTAARLIDLAEQQLGQSAGTLGVPRAMLLGIATHGRGALARWTLGSVAYRVLEGSHLPVLIVRPRAITQQQQATREHVLASSPLSRTAPIRPVTSPANQR